MKIKLWKKSRVQRLMAFSLVIAMVFSLAGCGKEERDTRQKARSIFDFFDEEPDTSYDPWATEEPTTEPGTGDVIVDPPVIDPPSQDPNQYSDTENEEFNKLLEENFVEYMESSSLAIHNYLKDPEKFGVKVPEEVTLGEEVDYSEEAIEEARKEAEEWIVKFEAIDVNTLTEQQRFDYDYYLDALKSGMVTYENIYIGSAFSTMNGIQTTLPLLFLDWTFESKEDIQLYLDIMKLFPKDIREELEFEELRVEKGYGFEDVVIDELLDQCDQFTKVSGEHFMVTSFNEKIDAFAGLTDAEKEEYKKQDMEAVDGLISLYKDIHSTFEGAKGKNQVKGGLCNYEDHGKEIYAYLVREYSGSSKTPEELIRYLENKNLEYKTRMQSLYLMYPEAYEYYTDNKKTLFDYLEDEDPKEIEDYLIEHAMEEFPDVGTINYRILPYDKTMEKIRDRSVAYYRYARIDDPDDNTIRVNGNYKDEIWATLAHEGCPGHMYQFHYYQQTKPNNLRLLSHELGYGEGWAEYASDETMKYCDFNGSPYASVLAELFTLESRYLFNIQGIIDLSVNALGWTVDDIRDYLSRVGLSTGAAEEFYVTFVSNPGVYLSYSVGPCEMRDLRDYAEESLGSKFDVVEFHKTILDAGPCKFDQLKKRVDKYILEHK